MLARSDQANLIAPEPFPMFTNDGNGIQLTSTAECVLSQLQKGYKLKVISVAGGYRSSKNYLMNHWIRARKGHSMANVVQAEAEGIWAWGRILHDEKSYLLVLDTEGLGDCVRAKDPEKDMRFYTLAMLLSSYFVLNVTRVGEDENTIALLRYATQLSETLVRRATEHPEADGMRTAKLDAALQRYLPDLMILIRDAALMSILEIPGMNATPEDYLSSCLKDKGNDGNTTKLAIDTHFPSLWCEAIRAPSERNDVEQLGNMPDNELDPKFIAKMTQIADQILHIVQPKRYFGDLSGTDGMETRVLDGPCE
ncbi:guanylate-binding protein [Gaertneriomyces semiglobifer]|nr:guanylate-binding protein [Gaertneriomyces semiglobifer]